MKPVILAATLLLGAAVSQASAAPTKRLHFAHNATALAVRGHLGHRTPSRVYFVKVNTGQKLRIEAESASKKIDSGIVPLIFVTPPGGKYDGDKTASYYTPSSRAGLYRIEVGVNQMATNGLEGDFLLRLYAN